MFSYRSVVHTHVVVCEIGGGGSEPIDVGCDFVVDLIVPIVVVSNAYLEIGVHEREQP